MRVALRVVCILFFMSYAWAAEPPVPAEYRRHFAKFSEDRSLFSERVAPLFGGARVGRSFALVAGVSEYRFGNLPPAAVDLDSVVSYLVDEEYFDEVILLRDSDVNYRNFKFFLQSYLKSRVHDFPQSRFLFAYSGHGFLDGQEGYLVQSNASHLKDFENSIGVDVLRPLIKRVVDQAHHSLVLLNACHAGAFLSYYFGDRHYIPKKRGAHAITAGGTDEQSFSIPSYGNGSVFFEAVLDGVRGAADSIPLGGDGVVTSNELFGYLHEQITGITTSQTPRQGDLRPANDSSEGSFFFLDKDVEISEPSLLENLLDAISFGSGPVIESLVVEPPVVVRGQKMNVSWTSSNTTICSFSDNDVEYSTKGNRALSPVDTIDLLLRCTRDGRASEKTVQLKVLPPPIIVEFGTSSLRIENGQSTQIRWEARDAEQCSIDQGIGAVTLKGGIIVRPSVNTTYTLYCSTQNVQKEARVRIEVVDPAPVCSKYQVLDGDACIERCEPSEFWNGKRCESRCIESERWVRGECRDRCDDSQSWNGRRCVARCTGNQTWDGYECVSEGFPPGWIVRPCGCWGFVNFGARDIVPECQSNFGEAFGCPLFCPAGGYQWGVRCL